MQACDKFSRFTAVASGQAMMVNVDSAGPSSSEHELHLHKNLFLTSQIEAEGPDLYVTGCGAKKLAKHSSAGHPVITSNYHY